MQRTRLAYCEPLLFQVHTDDLLHLVNKLHTNHHLVGTAQLGIIMTIRTKLYYSSDSWSCQHTCGAGWVFEDTHILLLSMCCLCLISIWYRLITSMDCSRHQLQEFLANDCTWQTLHGRLYLADPTWQTLRGILYLADSTWHTQLARLYVVDSTWLTLKLQTLRCSESWKAL